MLDEYICRFRRWLRFGRLAASAGLIVAMQLALVAPAAQAQDQPKAQDAPSQNRIALVVGNANYRNVPLLTNPPNDAQDVAETLGRIGFVVTRADDLDYVAFRNAVLEFKRSAQSADMAILYFAGHGIEIEGENWLLPVDAELRSDADAPSEAIGLRWAMGAVESARSLGLVILDACRNNPFRATMKRARLSRAAPEAGLAPVDTADNVLVAYASRHGTIARDGTGRNSPFTGALLRHIETPGLEVDFLFRNIRDDVIAATNELQQPVLYGSLSSDEIFLVPPPAGHVADPDQPDAVEVAWSFLKETDDVASLTQFVERFKGNRHTDEAREKIAMLTRAKTAGKDAKAEPKPAAVETSAAETETRIAARPFRRDTPAIKEAWEVVKQSRDQRVIRRFAEQFPSQERRVTANKRLADLGQQPVRFNNAALPVISYETTIDQIQQAQMSRATHDTDVLSCMGSGGAGACGRALVKYPALGEFLARDSFTSSVCASLGRSGGDCSGFIATNPTIASIRNNASGMRDQSPGLASFNANSNSPGGGGGLSGGSGPGGNTPAAMSATPAATAPGANNPAGATTTTTTTTGPTMNTGPTARPADAGSSTAVLTPPSNPSVGDPGQIRPSSVGAGGPTEVSKGDGGSVIRHSSSGSLVRGQEAKPGADKQLTIKPDAGGGADKAPGALTLAKPDSVKPEATKPDGVKTTAPATTTIKPDGGKGTAPAITTIKPDSGKSMAPAVTTIKPDGGKSTPPAAISVRPEGVKSTAPAISVKPAAGTRVGATNAGGTAAHVSRPAIATPKAGASTPPPVVGATTAVRTSVPTAVRATTAAGTVAATTAGRAAAGAAGNAASSAAGKAASNAASNAASSAAGKAASNAASNAAASAASRAASDAAGRVAATSAGRAAADAAGRAATTAAGKAASDAASRVRVPAR